MILVKFTNKYYILHNVYIDILNLQCILFDSKKFYITKKLSVPRNPYYYS